MLFIYRRKLRRDIHIRLLKAHNVGCEGFVRIEVELLHVDEAYRLVVERPEIIPKVRGVPHDRELGIITIDLPCAISRARDASRDIEIIQKVKEPVDALRGISGRERVRAKE